VSERRRILVVDDEPQITRVLRTSLSGSGYEIQIANEGETALEIAASWSPDLVITDISMPNMDGLELCRRLRILGRVPILVLSVKDEERTKVQALDAGADDYVTKPFSMDELLARVRAHLRRVPDSTLQTPIVVGDFRIDLETHRISVRGRDVRLTPKEFELLVYFARNSGKLVTHRNLLTAVWGDQSAQQVEYLRVFIGQLRKKLEAEDNGPQYILTEPRFGYRFEPAAKT